MPVVRLTNHTVHFMCSLRKLYQQKELTDCVLVTRGGLIHAHKIILSVYSPYIKKLLMNDGGITNIDFMEVEQNIMKLIMDMMYFGEADVPDTNVLLFLETTKLLQITTSCFGNLNFSETLPKRNSNLYNNASTGFVDLLKSYERNLPVLENEVMHNQDVLHAIETKSNSSFDTIDLQSIHSPEAEERNILKHLSGKGNDGHSKDCIQNSCDTVKAEECAGGEEDLENELSPITFIAVPPVSVKCEEVDDEHITSYISELQLKNPLEDCLHESGTSNIVSFKSEQELISELQIKIENDEKIAINDAKVVQRSCSNYVPFVTKTEQSYLESAASVNDSKLIDIEPIRSRLGISGSNDDSNAEGTEDLKVRFESICEISEFNLKEENSVDTDLDFGNTEDIEPLLLNQNSESENYKVDVLSVIDPQQDLDQGLDDGCISTVRMKEARVLLNRNNSLYANNKDNKYLDMYEKSASTSVQSMFCDVKRELKTTMKESEKCHNDRSLISKKQITLQPLVQRDPLHQPFKPPLGVKTCIIGKVQTYSTKVMKNLCNICGKSFRKVCDLRKHKTEHSPEKFHSADKTFDCEVCKKSFSQEGVLIKHMRTHRGDKPFKCDICKISFSLKQNLNTHMSTHTGHRPFECETCKKSFSLKGGLIKHMRTHSGHRPFECEICKRSFSQKAHLIKHMRTHTGDKPFECDICKRAFSLKQTLNTHMSTHTGHRPFECEICKKSFSHKGHLIIHMRIHTGNKPFVCDICKRAFSLKQNLNTHMSTHTGQRPFECEICKKTFSQQGGLIKHMRTHSGHRPFECEICKKSFSQGGDLIKHMRTHRGDKPFECDICNRAFSLKQNLNTHMRTHTGQRPIECET